VGLVEISTHNGNTIKVTTVTGMVTRKEKRKIHEVGNGETARVSCGSGERYIGGCRMGNLIFQPRKETTTGDEGLF